MSIPIQLACEIGENVADHIAELYDMGIKPNKIKEKYYPNIPYRAILRVTFRRDTLAKVVEKDFVPDFEKEVSPIKTHKIVPGYLNLIKQTLSNGKVEFKINSSSESLLENPNEFVVMGAKFNDMHRAIEAINKIFLLTIPNFKMDKYFEEDELTVVKLMHYIIDNFAFL